MKQSAGILLYRIRNGSAEFLLGHPGGPFWKNKDLGAWSIPKGEFADDEEPLAAAIREFEEETGFAASGDFLPLTPVKLKSGKTVHAFALKGDLDASCIVSNAFEIEWPPRSGKMQAFPEIDRAGWFPLREALEKIRPEQAALVREMYESLKTT
jgi:predicted NUDIX family NTP pyrophosphohydrolase